MRTLFALIWKFYFAFLFILLEIFASFLIVQNNSFHKAGFLNSSNALSASLFKITNNISQYMRLRSTNELLAIENEKLHSQSILSFVKFNTGIWTINDTIFEQQYTYLSARVINNSIYKRNNYLTLNKGERHGIEPEMAVISSNGIVGIVKDVSDNFSSVLSVLHKDARISAKIKKSGSFGSLVWDGADFKTGTLSDIPVHAKISEGDTIVTSRYSAIFPDGILIGTIVGFKINPGDNFYTISVKFSTDFSNLSYVYVVDNLMKDEQILLEEASQLE